MAPFKGILALLQAAVLVGSSFPCGVLWAGQVQVVVPESSPIQSQGSVGAGLGAGTQAGVGPAVSLAAPLPGQLGLLPSIVAPELSLQKAPGVQPVVSAEKGGVVAAGPGVKPVVSQSKTAAVLPAKTGAPAPKTEEKPSALKGLLQHGPQAGKIAQAGDLGEARGSAESNFLKAAALGETVAPQDAAETALLPRIGAIFKNFLRRNKDAKTDAKKTEEPPAPVAPAPVPEERYRELVLPNGMHVQLLRNPSLFTATVAVGYDVGGRDDTPGQTGYAHFTEHLMFQGTRRVKNWFRMMGAMGGNTNAWTYADHTLYVNTVPVNLLELALSLEAERMANLDISPEKVEREKRVILEEKAGSENAPFESGWNKLFGLMFRNPSNHRNVLGTEEDIRSATAEKMKKYFESHYTPDKAKLVVSGNIDLDQTERWVRELMGAVPARQSPAPARDLSEPEGVKTKTAKVKDAYAAQTALLFGWKGPAYGSKDYYAAGILAEMLQERLHQKLVYGQKKAVGVSMNVPYLERDPAAMTGSILFSGGMTEVEAVAALEAEIEALRTGQFSEEDLRRQIAKVVQAVDNQLGDPYSATMLLTQAAVRGLPGARLEQDLRSWSQVTAADIRQAAELFSAKGRSTVLVQPDAEQRKQAKPFEHRYDVRVDEAPTPEEARILESLGSVDWVPVKYRAPEEFTLPNGLKVVVMPDNRRSTVYAKLAFRLGATAANADLRRKAPFVANLLRLRTAKHSELEMESMLAAIGGWIQTGQKFDHVVFDGNAPAEQAASLLNVLSDMVSHPYDWTEEELANWKNWWKESLKSGKGDPTTASHLRAIIDLLGDHPSAQGSLTPEALDALGTKELAALARTHFAPDNAVLVVAGDISPQWLKNELPKLFEEWKPAKQPGSRSPKVEVKEQKTISLVDRPGSEQAIIRVSAVKEGAGTVSAPDFFPLQVASHIMGSGWASKLFQVARQAMGAAYNTFSQVVTDPSVAMWSFGLFTRQEKVEPALKALMGQIAEMREKTPSALDLTSARNSLIASFLMSLDYIGSIADHLLGLELLGEPLAQWGLYPQKVSEVTGETVQRVSRDLLDPSKLALTVVGDAQKIAGGLAQERPVQVFDQDGNPKD